MSISKKTYILIVTLVIGFSQLQAQNIFDYYQGLFTSEERSVDLRDRLIMDINYDTWLDIPPGIELRPVSVGMNIYRTYDVLFKKEGAVSFAFGYGFSTHNTHHNGFFDHVVDSVGNSFTHLRPYEAGYEYKKNKHLVTYVDVPLEFRIRTNKRPIFRLTLGAKVGYKVHDHSKIRDDNGKIKVYGIKNLMPYRYGLYGRLGLGKFLFTGYYALTPLFTENKGPQIIPMSIGVSMVIY